MRELSEYDLQAKAFLERYGVKFTATFTHYGAHFDGETACRDNFRCRFSRGKKRLVIDFGQSLNDSDGGGGNPPRAYDVLACIGKNDPGLFEEFCREFGYETDSRRAEKTYKAVVKEWKNVSAFFTAEELEALQEIR